jgi:phosphatidylglycerophosphate synthase
VRLGWLPNAICVLRMLLVVPLMIALLGEHYAAAVILLVVAGASDGLDGFLAKTFGWQTRLGSLLDPAADKLLLVSVFVGLACQLGFVFFAMTSAGFDWPPRAAVLIFGAAVVFTSLVSGLSYVLGWSRRAWRVARAST